MEDVKKLADKIDAVQKDLAFIKLNLAKSLQTHPKKIVSIKGSLKNLKIEEDDIKTAKKSLFKTGA